MRTSKVAYIVVRLPVGARDYFLLQLHRKWGDWSLVGGHVEAFEQDDWSAAACREADEELAPLRCGTDFTLQAISGGPDRLGPLESRSAGGALTTYAVAWFALVFLRDPVSCVRRLPKEEFVLVDRQLALAPGLDRSITPLLRRLDDALPKGMDDVPLAWAVPLDADALGLETKRDPARSSDPSLALR